METFRNYFTGSYKIMIVMGALFTAIVVDSVMTRYLALNRLAYAVNPFLRFWGGEETSLTCLTIKFLGGILTTLYLWNLYKQHPKISICCSSLFLTAYTTIVFWNIFTSFID